MPVSWLLVIAAAVSYVPDDPSEHVARLLSNKSAEREAAEQALMALGELAIPALNQAADSRDLELRHKAAALMDAIDGRGLSRPTLVPLNYTNRPIGEVVAGIARDAGISLQIEAQGDVRFRERQISLKADGPVALWDAIDRLTTAANLKLDPPLPPGFPQRAMFLNNPQRGRRAPTSLDWVLRPDDGVPQAPSSVSGPFRVSISSLVLDRNRSFVRTPETVDTPAATAQFSITLGVRTEPRMTLASLDPPLVTEAVDERGRSLLGAPPIPGAFRSRQPFVEAIQPSSQSVALKLPDDPGRSIARLKGTIRGLAIGRRKDPLVLSLAGSVGKTFSVGTTALTVHTIRLGPNGRDTTLEFTVDTTGTDANSQPVFNPQDPRAALRPPPAARGQIEFYDAKGRLVQNIDLAASGMPFGFNGRTTVMVQPPDGLGAPVEARYYGAIWSPVEIPFEFRDVAMP